MKKTFIFILSISLMGCSGLGETAPRELLPQSEIVMSPGMRITASNKNGTVTIEAGEGTFRKVAWNGTNAQTESVSSGEGRLLARRTRFYGMRDIYDELHGHSNVGLSRIIVREAQRHFGSVGEVMQFLNQRWYKDTDTVYTDDGLLVLLAVTPKRNQLNVDINQILINGQKPKDLPGARNHLIKIDEVK